MTGRVLQQCVLCLMGLTAIPTASLAQTEEPASRWEVGLTGGVTILDSGGGFTIWSLPGGGIQGLSSFYVERFTRENLSFGVQATATGTKQDVLAIVGVVGRGTYYLPSVDNATVYLSAHSGVVRAGSRWQEALGGAVGYRSVPMDHVALRLEVGVRRWFAESGKLMEYTLMASAGVLLP